MFVHRSESWHEQSRMGTFLRTGPRLHETSSSIISDRSKVVNFAGSWRYLTPLLSLSLSLYTCNGIPMFRFSPVYHLESHLDLSKSAIVSPAERKMVARTCAGFLLPSIVGKNLSFTDKASSFNGTPLMRDILVDREISGTWSLVSYRGEHAVCSIRFFSLLSFSHGFDNWFCLAIIISVYG